MTAVRQFIILACDAASGCAEFRPTRGSEARATVHWFGSCVYGRQCATIRSSLCWHLPSFCDQHLPAEEKFDFRHCRVFGLNRLRWLICDSKPLGWYRSTRMCIKSAWSLGPLFPQCWRQCSTAARVVLLKSFCLLLCNIERNC